MLFYGPYNRYMMKIHMKKKTIEQQNQVLPEKLKLEGNEDEKNYKKDFLKNKNNSTEPRIWTETEETKRLLAKAALKNAEENLEFIDEIKTNIVQNEYLAKKLTDYQRKLLPLAYVYKLSKEIESGKVTEHMEKREDKDIMEVYKKFKNTPVDPNESEEMKKIREYILKNASFLEEVIPVSQNEDAEESFGGDVIEEKPGEEEDQE